MSNKVLIILSSSSSVTLQTKSGEQKQQETGVFLKELADPLRHILSAGYQPVFASPTGEKPHIDPLSDSAIWYLGSTQAKESDKKLITDSLQKVQKFADISSTELESFAGVFVPGGHAPMTDLGQDKELGRILTHFHDRKKPTAVICHGPIALLSTKNATGGFPYQGYKVTCYASKEEIANEFMWGGKLRKVEDALKEAGCDVQTAMVPLMSKVVVDRELVSGENPTSADGLGEKFVGLLYKLLQLTIHTRIRPM
ncbi:ThiJ/PfpI family protein [Crassisporium funariophilum]|nr:ThiJ/PfpI family protein [Crassisporium funariophilum]